jgi:hypothetical protein
MNPWAGVGSVDSGVKISKNKPSGTRCYLGSGGLIWRVDLYTRVLVYTHVGVNLYTRCVDLYTLSVDLYTRGVDGPGGLILDTECRWTRWVDLETELFKPRSEI